MGQSTSLRADTRARLVAGWEAYCQGDFELGPRSVRVVGWQVLSVGMISQCFSIVGSLVVEGVSLV